MFMDFPTPKSSMIIGCSSVIMYKPSILGYPSSWKPPLDKN